MKTRLAKTIGDEQALKLYEKLVENTLRQAQGGSWSFSLHWAFPNEVPAGFSDCESAFQSGEHLGERMYHSIHKESENHDKVVLIGADIPGISSAIISSSFELLDTQDIVFGPAQDGGYYLVGMKGPIRQIFETALWSHDRVLKDAIDVASANSYNVGFVETLNDLDDADDLRHFPVLNA